MGQPSKEEIRVATDALRAEAGIWSEEGEKCTTLEGVVQGLSMTGLQGGLLFIPYVEVYQDVCALMASVLNQGGKAMESISVTLVESARMYDEEEANNVHLAEGKW